ncbi:MAG TPA: phosphate acetyltransferase [Thermoleophilaceae bacterium]
MARSVYVTALEPQAGKSVVALGMVELLAARADRVGFFRPVVEDPDPQIELVRRHYDLKADYRLLRGATVSEARNAVASGDVEELEKRVVRAYRELERDCDAIVIEGIDVRPGLDAELDARLANALLAPVLAVVRCPTGGDPADSVGVARETYVRRGCDLLGTIATRVPADRAGEARDALSGEADADTPAYVVPEEPELSRPTVAEVAAALGAEPVAGEETDREVRAVRVAAMGVGPFLGDLEDGTLVVVPGDRADILTASLAAAASPDLPAVAGVVVTTEEDPPPAVARMLERAPFPVVRTRERTYAVATAIAGVEPRLGPDDERRVATALGLFQSSVDPVELGERLAIERPSRMTPAMFEYELIERAKEDRRHIVLPEGDDERVLRAADILLRRGVVYLTILGDPEEVRARAAAHGLDLSEARIVDPANAMQRQEYARRYHEMRKHRGMTEELAYETAGDVTWFGTFMVQSGEADGMVSGAAHTTADTIRPAFQIIKSRPGVSVVSSVFLMCMPDRVLVFGDCAVNPKPSTTELADIAINSAETAWSFGVEPRVAMLSYSTGESGKGPDVTEVREATELVRERRPDIPVEGPIQYDAAIEPEVAAKKMPESDVAGRATVFIFPDLETGNIAYKAVQRSSGAVAIGPVLQGMRKPINDLSRGCLVPDIVSTTVITAIQAQEVSGRSTSRLRVKIPPAAT